MFFVSRTAPDRRRLMLFSGGSNDLEADGASLVQPLPGMLGPCAPGGLDLLLDKELILSAASFPTSLWAVASHPRQAPELAGAVAVAGSTQTTALIISDIPITLLPASHELLEESPSFFSRPSTAIALAKHLRNKRKKLCDDAEAREETRIRRGRRFWPGASRQAIQEGQGIELYA